MNETERNTPFTDSFSKKKLAIFYSFSLISIENNIKKINKGLHGTLSRTMEFFRPMAENYWTIEPNLNNKEILSNFSWAQYESVQHTY